MSTIKNAGDWYEEERRLADETRSEIARVKELPQDDETIAELRRLKNRLELQLYVGD